MSRDDTGGGLGFAFGATVFFFWLGVIVSGNSPLSVFLAGGFLSLPLCVLGVSFPAFVDFVNFPLGDFREGALSAVEDFFGVLDSLVDQLFLVDPDPPDLLDLDDEPEPPATDGVKDKQIIEILAAKWPQW